ncbi:MAG: hypothetical protein EOS17_00580 [Mesorhizobium sp.]|nr:MAG: hypothetical protein EOS17_00580 [Mesorhizobium sp.]
MHRLPTMTALLISFGVAYGICVWATSDKPVSFFQAKRLRKCAERACRHFWERLYYDERTSLCTAKLPHNPCDRVCGIDEA